MLRILSIRRAALAGLATAAVLGVALGPSGATTRLVHHVIIPFKTNQSGNWSGYNIGTLSYNDARFTAMSGQWTVPKATGRHSNDSEYSSTWVGIGGGCVDSNCDVTDSTLIQTGTEQDVINGHAQYSAWWEIIPEPSTPIAHFTVAPGDHMYARIWSTTPGEWSILLQDLTRGEKFSTSTAYPSSELTAEWITETPVIVNGAGSGVATLPNLSGDVFDHGAVNGKSVVLSKADEIQLSPSPGVIWATPSAPDSDREGFRDCSYATSCSTPTS